jgi:hypothetical protein
VLSGALGWFRHAASLQSIQPSIDLKHPQKLLAAKTAGYYNLIVDTLCLDTVETMPLSVSEGAAMTRWETKFVIAEKIGKGVFGFILPREISWKVHYVNGKQQQNWDDVTLFNYLNDEGKEGWEVASMSTHLSVRSGTLPIEHIYIILKRPLQQAER